MGFIYIHEDSSIEEEYTSWRETQTSKDTFAKCDCGSGDGWINRWCLQRQIIRQR